MTEFCDLELIYNQSINLTEEINTLIKQEDYISATLKMQDKIKLLKKIAIAKKTTNLSHEEKNKLQVIEQKLKEDNELNLTSLKAIQNELKEEIKKTKGKVKISSAYATETKTKQGTIIDISE